MNFNYPRRATSSKATGFTLIELLVVIAIIAILAAILFPVFGRARENARRSSCQSNLKQIGLGLIQYSQDYDEKMVRVSYGPGADPGVGQSNFERWKWVDAVQPYIKSTQIFDCPSNSNTNTSPYYYNQPGVGNNDPDPGTGTWRFGSYTMNCQSFRSAPSDNDADVAGAAIEDAAGTLWVADMEASGSLATSYRFAGNGVSLFPVGSSIRFVNNDNPGSGDGGAIKDRHLETSNVLFCDGHVKALRLDAIARQNPGTTVTSLNRLPMLTTEID